MSAVLSVKLAGAQGDVLGEGGDRGDGKANLASISDSTTNHLYDFG